MKVPLACFVCALAIGSPAFAQCPNGSDTCVTTTGLTNGTGPGTTTVTRFDNRVRATSVGDQVSSATQVGLTYFFQVLPEIQRERNERRSDLEGQFTPAYRALDDLTAVDVPHPPASAVGTQPQEIKGLRLGETWSAFLSAAPHLKGEVARCQAKARPDPGKHRKTVPFEPCAQLWAMSDDPSAQITLTCLEKSHGAGRDMVCQDFDGEVSFSDGRLIGLKLALANSWSDVLPDLTRRFGPPNGEAQDASAAIWIAPGYYLNAMNNGGPAVLSWMTRSRYAAVSEAAHQSLQDDQTARPSSID